MDTMNHEKHSIALVMVFLEGNITNHTYSMLEKQYCLPLKNEYTKDDVTNMSFM